MFNSKLTFKLLFVIPLLLAAGSVPAPMAAKTPTGVCFASCDRLDQLCRQIGGTPGACLDLIPTATHQCVLVAPPNQPGDYVNECVGQGGLPFGGSFGLGGCTKVCL